MNDQQKPSKPGQAGQDPHPETKRRDGAKLPDDKSSKVAPDERHDARTGHDKDGNDQQRPPKRAAP